VAKQGGQGPLNDPRLVERRGDLAGLNALMFVILVIVGFLAAALLLYTLIRSAPAAPPSSSPTVAATSTAAPTASREPSPSASPSAIPTVAASLPISVSVGTAADLVVDGQVAGQATVLSARYGRFVQGKPPPKGMRWLLVRVQLTATATLAFDENLWTAIDTKRTPYGWRGYDPPPSLGRGTLQAGDTRAGYITFQVPAQRRIVSLTLESNDGSPLVTVRLP
jgi:hypothetical protein